MQQLLLCGTTRALCRTSGNGAGSSGDETSHLGSGCGVGGMLMCLEVLLPSVAVPWDFARCGFGFMM